MTSELIGKTLGNRYRFEELIGEGTFAEVYRITDLRRRATLAAKVLRSDIARDTALLERFQREASVLARLQHPNIVRYYDIVDQDGYRFILMDYIPGDTLNDVMKNAPEPIRPNRSLEYVTPLASALHFAHNEGIIHRDLKPANILLHENGTLYVTDFGIARLLNMTSELTMGTTIGTPLYMAPEQITGDPVTVATDIYAFGVILYRMYTGEPPFRGDSPTASGSSVGARIIYEHVHTMPEAPTSVNPRLDLAVQEIIMRCLQKDPAARFESISELYDALAEAVGAPPIPIESTGEYPAVDPDAGPPDIKLPEWSQFMPSVASTPDAGMTQQRDEMADLAALEAPDDDNADAETLPPVADSIEHPVPQPKTQPHLEDAIRQADRTIPHQPSPAADRTIPSADRVIPHAHPTPRHPAAPPEPSVPPPHIAPPARASDYDYDYDYDAPPRRRGWFTVALISGTLVIIASLCVAVLYLSGIFDSGESTRRNPEADITLSARPGTLEGVAPETNATSDTTNPDVTAGGSRIAFDSRRNGDLDIYIMNTDGTRVQQLTGSSGAERGPSWSPDGTQIAFYGASSENGNYDIFVINTDGSNLRNLTQSAEIDDRYPSWSPDGSRIAFHSNAGGDFDIYIINADGSNMRPVTNNNADDLGPDWSPDGTQIAFHTSLWDFPYELAVLDLNTGQIRRLTNNNDTNTFPTWSPDGAYIAYNAISSITAAANIFVMNTDGSNNRQITSTQERSTFPDWSPDGTQIIYQHGQPDVSSIYAIPASGGAPTPVTIEQRDFLPEWEPYH